ncbi:MAG TPA: hypothetical protein VKD90_28500 [Gemmataceae bacterium]|nr:hypothetical protein [Gemmataceae bacterium]
MGTLRYHGSDNSVRVGDRILVHRRLGRSRLATVVYVPGQVEHDPEVGDDQWAYKTDDGSVYAATYIPDELPHADKGIEFVFRAGEEAALVIASYRIPPEAPSAQPGRDFLALVGCGTLVAIFGLSACLVAAWVTGRP